jgi:hypothetical protein
VEALEGTGKDAGGGGAGGEDAGGGRAGGGGAVGGAWREGEMSLLRHYHAELKRRLPPAAAAACSWAALRRQYTLGVVDFGRAVVGAFYKSASPDGFAARADNANVCLANRNVRASRRFVRRVDACLREVETGV